jgi:hypothetical protein
MLLPAPTEKIDFPALLQRLETLSRAHLLFYRLEVGRLILEEIFDGEPEAYLSRDNRKATRFTQFLAEQGEALRELGLGEQVLRQCVTTRIAAASLPPALLERLLFSHLVELSRMADHEKRRFLATLTIEQGWTSRQLRGAVQATAAGLPLDIIPEQPGIQPPQPEPEQRRPLPAGRVITRFEKAADDFEDLGTHWEHLDPASLSSGQRNRIAGSVQRLRARLDALEKRLL